MAPAPYIAPGFSRPKVTPARFQAEVGKAMGAIAHEAATLPDPYIRTLMPILRQAQAETAAALRDWLASHAKDGAERFTAQRYRQSLLQLGVAIETLETRLGGKHGAMAGTLVAQGAGAGAMAISHLQQEVASFAAVFGQSVIPLQLNQAAILAKGDRYLIPQYRNSAARYGKDMAADIRQQLAIGVAKGETFDEMTSRLVRMRGPRGLVSLRGMQGSAKAYHEDIAEGLFVRYRYWAERIVRTEGMNAYNEHHLNGLRAADADDPGYQKRWDASIDGRTCPICRDLDGTVADIDKPFPGPLRLMHPPAHPNDRCTVTPWRREWSDGEHVEAVDPGPAIVEAQKVAPAPQAAPAPVTVPAVVPKPARITPPKPAPQPAPDTAAIAAKADADAKAAAAAKLAAEKAKAEAEAAQAAIKAAAAKAAADLKAQSEAKLAAERAAAEKLAAEAKAAKEKQELAAKAAAAKAAQEAAAAANLAAKQKAEAEAKAAAAEAKAKADAAAKLKAEQELAAKAKAAKPAAASKEVLEQAVAAAKEKAEAAGKAALKSPIDPVSGKYSGSGAAAEAKLEVAKAEAALLAATAPGSAAHQLAEIDVKQHELQVENWKAIYKGDAAAKAEIAALDKALNKQKFALFDALKAEQAKAELERVAALENAPRVPGQAVQLPPPPPYEYTQQQRDKYKREAVASISESREHWDQRTDVDLSREVRPGFTYAASEFSKIRSRFASGLTTDEFDACLYYSHQGDRVLNSAHRYGMLPSEPDVKARSEALERAIRKHKMEKDTFVARGMSGQWASHVADLLKPGDTFSEPGFCSTSATSPFQGEVRLRIKIPAGAAAAPIPTRYPEEYEFLLPPGTKFRVVENRKVSNRYEIDVEVIP